jgi:hypothetical protein
MLSSSRTSRRLGTRKRRCGAGEERFVPWPNGGAMKQLPCIAPTCTHHLPEGQSSARSSLGPSLPRSLVARDRNLEELQSRSELTISGPLEAAGECNPSGDKGRSPCCHGTTHRFRRTGCLGDSVQVVPCQTVSSSAFGVVGLTNARALNAENLSIAASGTMVGARQPSSCCRCSSERVPVVVHTKLESALERAQDTSRALQAGDEFSGHVVVSRAAMPYRAELRRSACPVGNRAEDSNRVASRDSTLNNGGVRRAQMVMRGAVVRPFQRLDPPS